MLNQAGPGIWRHTYTEINNDTRRKVGKKGGDRQDLLKIKGTQQEFTT
jgi:hypothetical protein